MLEFILELHTEYHDKKNNYFHRLVHSSNNEMKQIIHEMS